MSVKFELKYLNLWFLDGALLDECGVEYLSPPPLEVYLIY